MAEEPQGTASAAPHDARAEASQLLLARIGDSTYAVPTAAVMTSAHKR